MSRVYRGSMIRSRGSMIGAFAAFVLVAGTADYLLSTANVTDHRVVVTGKERVCSGNSDGGTDCKYLIYTTETTFEDTDTIWWGKFNSSDHYGALQIGQTYDLTTTGYRIGFMSAYANIVAINGERLN